MQHHCTVLANAEYSITGFSASGDDLAHDVDALGFQALKMGEGFVGHRPSLNLLK